MGTFQQYVQDDPEIVDRFVIHAFKRNSSIKTLDDFKEALKTADPSDDRIKRADSILDDDTILDLFNSEACKGRLRQNLDEREYNELFEGLEAGAYEVSVPKPERRREPVFKEPVMKKINVPSYWREGELVRAYKKTPNKRWDDKEIKFITKLKDTTKTADIVRAYIKKYGEGSRSESSIKTRVYRT
jgi:hypothetical protein